MGGFAGYNGSGNASTAVNGEGRDYVSYAAHLYWGAEPGSRPVRFKADVIGVLYETLSTVPEQQTLGFSALGAVGLNRSTELFGRFEVYEPNLDVDGGREVYLTAGFHFSPSSLRGGPFARERFTLGYSARLPEADGLPAHHLVVLQAQVFF